MSKKSKISLKLSRRTIALALVIGCIVFAFGVGALISWLQRPASPKQESEITGLSDALLTKSQNQVQQLSNRGKYDEAHKAATEALAKSTQRLDR